MSIDVYYLLVILGTLVLACLLLYCLASRKVFKFNRHSFPLRSGIAVITAHPDDECMFFAPALLELSETCNVHILCATTGDYYKQGFLRKNELINSCQILGIDKENVKILDDSSFPDDPKAVWDLKKLSVEIKSFIAKIQPHCILTFDLKGVSHHPNHIAISQLVRTIYSTEKKIKVYELESVPLVRKYCGIFDLPLSLASGQLMFVSSLSNILKAQRAMIAHKTQLVWFRILYIIFSRYMVINTFTLVKP
ncbi:N-acetylglucosaminyl-phosphatidylinositol de-N-acetylase-like [Physella acuta]|uniref:N-acetylglucosaminyl-phosphatidylinositol de-N-acetylase-like n=1 Tax=Physella acuta TaxID=109671 RepID=UPI0027DB4EB8|nr:N-acetylglucosaminyl-phosphatidylinositol de-N-acetylase-like [Physella acuta]